MFIISLICAAFCIYLVEYFYRVFIFVFCLPYLFCLITFNACRELYFYCSSIVFLVLFRLIQEMVSCMQTTHTLCNH